MTKDIWLPFLNVYFQFVFSNVMIIYVICNSFPLKINKKRAYIIAFIYAQYMPVTDALSLVLIGGRILPYTDFVYILLKINIFFEALVFLLFFIRYVDKVWYRAYWWYISLVMGYSIPYVLYSYYFTKAHPIHGTMVQPINSSTLPLYILLLIINIVWGLPFLLIGRRFSRIKKIDQISKWNWYIFYACFVLLLFFSEKNYFLNDTILKGISNYKNMAIFTFGAIILLFITINQTEKRILRIENSLLMQHKELQYANYLTMQEQEQQIQILYKEIGQHIKSIQELLNKKENVKAENYTKELRLQYQSIRQEYYCNNKIINAVLSSKAKKCSIAGIVLQVELRLPDHLLIRDIDLMSLFSNLLDNAIEGCLRIPIKEKYISLKTSIIGEYITVKIINSKSKENITLKSKDKFISWKKDKKLHGYGLKIIEEIVERYEGQKEFLDQGEEFFALVMLKNQLS